MTVKEMKCALEVIRSAKNAIQQLDCENYPYARFEDDDFCCMFYQLNDMCIAIGKKIDAAEAAATKGE